MHIPGFRAAVLSLSLALLAGCERAVSTTASPAASGTGYARLDVLLKAHPLYPELARMDGDLAVLELRGIDPGFRSPDEGITRETQAMRRDLQAAEERARRGLAERQKEFVRQEDAAIAAVLSQGGVPTSSAEAIEGRIAAISREQARSVDEQARAQFQDYGDRLIAQSRAALASAQSSLLDRADRAYRLRADTYAREEAAFSFDQARKDAIEHLLLRARLADLALGKQEGAQAQARLNTLDKDEAREREAMRTRDQAALASYELELRRDMEEQASREARKREERIGGALGERAGQMRTGMLGQLAGVVVPQPAKDLPAAGLSPALREKLDVLHKRYQAAYAQDTEQTVREFTVTGEELSARFDRLAGIDAAAQEGAQTEIRLLRSRRGDLYRQIVAQITREAQAVAEQHGIGSVAIKVVGEPGGMDITPEVARHLESLHE